MSEDTGFQFTDDAVPKAYEEVLVLRLFEPWALLLLDECNLRPNAVVLPSQHLRSPRPSLHCPQKRSSD